MTRRHLRPRLVLLPALLAVAMLAPGCRRDRHHPERIVRKVVTDQITPALTSVTAESGFQFVSAPRQDAVGYGQGAAVADIDGDGDLDLYFPQDDGPCALFRNDGSWTFTEIAASAGVQVDSLAAHAKSAAFLDYDRDGDPDLFVGCAGEGNRFYRNRGDGTFDDVSLASGIGGGASFSVSAAVGDFNGDGWPDLYECNFAITDYDDPLALQETPAPNRLLHNNGNGTFTDVAPTCGVDDAVGTWAAHFHDIDGDGDQDLLVANDRFFFPSLAPIHDRLFLNGGGPGFLFEERGADWGLDESHYGMGFAIGDLDGDGLFDIYCSDLGANELRFAADPLPWPDRAPDLGMDHPVGTLGTNQVTWGAAICDVDADGRMDLVAGNGLLGTVLPSRTLQEPLLYLARDVETGFLPVAPLTDRRFVRSDGDSGLADVNCQGARTVLPADLDGDGDLDFVVSTRLGPAVLLRNDLPAKRPWYGVRLRGTTDTREGFGARLELHVGDTVVCDHLTAGGQPGGTLPPERILHPGPGAKGHAMFKVTWPDGTVQEASAKRGGWTLIEQP